MLYWIGFVLMKSFMKLYLNVQYINLDNLPKRGAYIIASNHTANIDPFVLGTSRVRYFSFFAKESLFKTKLSSWFFHELGAFPIKRNTSDFRAIREAFHRLEKGGPLILFPEGTRGLGDRVKKPQPGIGMIAVKSQVPVIPAYLENTDKIAKHGFGLFHKYPVKLHFGPPMHFNKDQDYREISSQIMDRIWDLSKTCPTLSNS